MAKLIYRGELAQVTGKKEERIEACSMYDVIRFLDHQYGCAATKAVARCLISLNGVGVDRIRSKAITVDDKSVVYFFPLCSGG